MIGGLKEKSLAAQQMQMKTVIAPADNAVDVDEIPKPLLKKIKFEFVSTIDQVLALALAPAKGSKAVKSGRKKTSANGRARSNGKPAARKPVKAAPSSRKST